jgi:hypothetical protein
MSGMGRYLSPTIFTANFSRPGKLTDKSYSLSNAKQIGFREKWLQDAIMDDPQIVLAPCREAGLISDEDGTWLPWAREVAVPDVGSIDVLLISSEGRVAIVETKLAYNQEARRKVVAQVLEYAINLNSIIQLPPTPTIDGHKAFVDPEIVRNGLQEGDYLLIIAGDQLDSRAVKLSEAALGKHLLRAWDLALVEVAVFEHQSESGEKSHLLVPHIRGTIVPERRQVVTIKLQGDRTSLEVSPATPVETGWDEERFFAKARGVYPPLQHFAEELRRLADEQPGVSLSFGRGKTASVTLLKEGNGILTFQIDGSGVLSFNPPAFPRALGQEQGSYYMMRLETLFPGMNKEFPYIKLQPKTAGGGLAAMLALLREVLTHTSTQTSERAAS